jgi:hypothetical protein
MKSVLLKVNVTAQIESVAEALGIELPEKFTLSREVEYQGWPETLPELVEKFGEQWLIERVPSFWAYHVGHGAIRAETEKALVALLGLSNIKKESNGMFPESVREKCALVFDTAVRDLGERMIVQVTPPQAGPTERQLASAKAALENKAELESAAKELAAAAASGNAVALAAAMKKLERLRRIQTPEAESESPEPEAEPAPTPKRNKKSVEA